MRKLFTMIMNNYYFFITDAILFNILSRKKNTINSNLFQTMSNIIYNYPRKKCPKLINIEKYENHCIFRPLTVFC